MRSIRVSLATSDRCKAGMTAKNKSSETAKSTNCQAIDRLAAFQRRHLARLGQCSECGIRLELVARTYPGEYGPVCSDCYHHLRGEPWWQDEPDEVVRAFGWSTEGLREMLNKDLPAMGAFASSGGSSRRRVKQGL